MSELEAIALCGQGDPDAFAFLYNKFHPVILGLCAKILKDPSEAEDVTQETFLQAYRKIGSFQGQSKFSTWLYRIAVNYCLMHLRSRKRSLPRVSDIEGAEFIEPTVIPTQPLRIQLDETLNSLNDDDRFVIQLQIEGYTDAECSRLFDMPVPTIKSRRWRAYQSLRGFPRTSRTLVQKMEF
jgi:RNA polymerase sigma-70 factor (ECF subfamily)